MLKCYHYIKNYWNKGTMYAYEKKYSYKRNELWTLKIKC